MDPVIIRLKQIVEANRCAAGVNDWESVIRYSQSIQARKKRSAESLISCRIMRHVHAHKGIMPGSVVAWNLDRAGEYRRAP